MNSLRRFAYFVFGVACLHLVFGAIVRISGSGMGCGPHWPKCYGYWFPPFDRPDLVIEVLHRYLASILLLSIAALVLFAWRRRAEAGIGGRGGVLRSASLALALGFAAAGLGAVTVRYGNAPWATVAHWTVAMSLVATVAATVIRAGGLGGASALLGGATPKSKRAAFIGAGMALITVVMGGLTAKFPGAAVACLKFPLCGANGDVARAAVHVQLTHRVLALLVVLHFIGLFFALRKRGEAAVVRRAAVVVVSFGVLQWLVAGAMIGMKLPPVLRSLHEATGVSIWISAFVLAYLARIASGGSAVSLAGATPVTPVPMSPDVPVATTTPADAFTKGSTPAINDLPDEGVVRAVSAPKTAYASVLAPREKVSTPAQPVVALAPAEVIVPVEVAAPVEVSAAPAPARVDAGEPIELEAATERAGRVAAAGALAFATLTAVAAMELAAPPVVAAPTVVAAPKATMTHSVAVIVARGADI